ncbi:hypothetical protein ABV409_14870 [Flagellimonas sp. DF-77]|uniref:hypothetical protein n=1 Tax=Flagellimonas algarum TaxID=3230298 RepID=UPI003396E353
MKNKLALFTALLVAQLAFGQKMDPVKMADYQTDLMVERLALTETQKTAVHAINQKYSVKQAELLNRKGSMFSKMGDMKKIKKAKNAEMEAVLTDEQMTILVDELEPEMREQMKKNKKG